MEPGGRTLFADGHCLTPGECLRIAIQLSGALAVLHERGRIHSAIRPGSIHYDAKTGEAHLEASESDVVTGEPGRLSMDDLAYISPEQTGRMNCAIDYRTDFYSLGVLLYRMLTGRLPFDAGDPLELAHSHIARLPKPPADVDSSIPWVVSNIVMKLLKKPAEDRYQSGRGLRFDLEECLAQLESKGRIIPFTLGTQDITDRLRIPRKLYGREKEVAELLAAFEHVTQGGAPMFVLVSGYSGIGKSSLAQVLQRPIAHSRGWFLAGKVDQYQRDVPYAAIAQAFRGVARQLLSESEARIAEWRQRLEFALQGNGRLITELIPEIELIIGPQPPMPGLPPAQAQNRFHRVFRCFIGVFAGPEHPLLIFLDDLQWLDAGTLKLMEEIITHPATRYLLLMGAYRDNEVGPMHPLTAMRERLDRAGANMRDIVLGPPEQKYLNQLLADALHCSPERSAPLARLISQKTQGNPFFFIQFLKELNDEGFLTFTSEQRVWTWDLARIEAKGFADNIVELMVGKLQRLPGLSLEALRIASCLGNVCEVETLAAISGRTLEDMTADLRTAIHEGLVSLRDGRCRFLHDRIQEAAYSLIPLEERAATHLRIGRSLLCHASEAALVEHIFDIVNQLNRGVDLIVDVNELEHLFRLNMQAGSKAKAAIAYASARGYFAQAVALLPHDACSMRYNDAFAAHLELAECEYLSGNFNVADALFDLLITKARDDIDRARVHRLQSKLCQMTGRFEEAMTLILDALRLTGVPLPESEDAVWAATDVEMSEIQVNLRGSSIANIADAVQAAHPIDVMIIGLLVEALSPAYATRPPYFPLLAAKAVNWSLRHGNTIDSSTAYNSYAIVLIAIRGDISTAFEFSEMALALIDKYDYPRSKGTVLAGHGGLVVPWRKHIAAGLPFIDQGLAALLDAGDFTSIAYLTILPVWVSVDKGEPLDHVVKAAEKYATLAREIHNVMAHDTVRLAERLAASLKGLTRETASFDGDDFSETDCLMRFTQGSWYAGVAYFHVMKQLASFIYGRYDESLQAAAVAESILRHMNAMPVAATLYFYQGLALVARYGAAGSALPPGAGKTLDDILRKLKHWAENCPENFHHRHALVSAEIARVEGRELEAERFYEKAIRSAHENGFVQNEALACELASNFYRKRDFEYFADAYLTRARACYIRWGALGKVKQLDVAYPQLKYEAASSPFDFGGARPLDALAVIKASQAVSREVVFDRLLATLMRTMIENAGAERGSLLLVCEDKLWVVAEACVIGESLDVRLCEEPPDRRLPVSVLNYAWRSRERVILDDASVFSSDDEYFVRECPKSVLCLPILRQMELVGLLYLENNLVANVFTSERLTVLELLAGQAAISLTNARLYRDVQQAEARLRRLVEANIIGIAIVEFDGRVTEANDAFLRLIGYERKDLTEGRISWKDITPPEYWNATEEAIEEVIARGACTPFETKYICRDGRQAPVLVGAANMGESRKQAAAFALDLTEHKRAEAEQRAREHAEAANKAKSEFLANMSHELRSPLSTILGFARLIARDPMLPEAIHEDIGLIVKSGEHLHTLINDVLDLSKLEAGRASVNEIEFRLDVLLNELHDLFGPASADKGVRLIFAPRPKPPCYVRADAVKLRQILINLIDNAIKFTSEGSVTVAVREQPSAESENPRRMTFAVTDTGPGIAANELEHLFDAFVQAEAGRRARKGTGLGLAISRRFVRLMGGEMGIKSEVGKGTEIFFEIPLCILKTNQQPQETLAFRVVGLAPGQAPYRLLIVDDLPEARQLLVRMLSLVGFELKEACDGREAIDIWRQWRPHLIWMDQHMPVMDGREATYRIKASPGGQETIIIALTASSFEEERQDILAAGCEDFLRKPFRDNEIFTLLEKHLHTRFIYKEESREVSMTLDASALTAMPEAERGALAEALIRLDADAVDALIETIGHRNRRLALTLTAMAKDFEYENMLALLQHGRS